MLQKKNIAIFAIVLTARMFYIRPVNKFTCDFSLFFRFSFLFCFFSFAYSYFCPSILDTNYITLNVLADLSRV